jgi:linoleoyl-CoA desaturase
MKFEKGKNSDFYRGLNLRVNEYFNSRKLARFATPQLYIKGLALFFVYVACYTGIYVFQDNYPALIVLYMLFGITGVMLVFNLVHDASHNAISKLKPFNKLICYLGDIVGINTYIWDIRHNIQHHSFTNVLGGDLVIENIPLLRMSPQQPYKRFHAWQPYYAVFLYLFYSLYWIMVIDFKLFFRREICNLKNIKHPLREWLLLILFKSFYIVYMIVLPVVFTSIPWYNVLLLFLLMHAVGGLLLSIVAVLGHFVMGPVFPEAKDGVLPTSWSEHELDATIDFAPSSRIVNWITGGLNTHVAHHLYPQICHTHYYAITPIIEKYCRENGFNYRKESLINALFSHYKFLKMLSQKEVEQNEAFRLPNPGAIS